ncbi:hypothetical protein Esti_006591 [Eimeria stiedai]
MAMASSEKAPASPPCTQGPRGPSRAPAAAQAAVLGMGQHLRLYGHLQHLQQVLQGAPASLVRPPLQHSGPSAIASPQATAASLLGLAEVRRLALALAGGRASPQQWPLFTAQGASSQPPQQPLRQQQSQQQQLQQPQQQRQQCSGITMHAFRVMQALRLAARVGVGGAAQGGAPSAPLGSVQSLQGASQMPPQQGPSLRGPVAASHASSVASESLRLLQMLRRRRQAWGGPPDVGAPSLGRPPSTAELPWHALVNAEPVQAPATPSPVCPASSSPLRKVVKPRAPAEEEGGGPPMESATLAWASPGPPAARRGAPAARRGAPAPGGASMPRIPRGAAAGPPERMGCPRKRRLLKSERYAKRASTTNAPSGQPRSPARLSLGAADSPKAGAPSSASLDSDADECGGAACSEQLLSAAAAAVASIPALTAAELLRAPVLPLRIEGMHAVGAPQLLQGRRHLQRFECPLCAPSARAPETYLKSYDHYVDYHWAHRKYLGAFVCFPCRLEHSTPEKAQGAAVAAEAASTVEFTAVDSAAAREIVGAGGLSAVTAAAAAGSDATGVAAAAAAAGDGCSSVLKALRLRRAAVGAPEGSAAAACERGPSLPSGRWGEGAALKGPPSSTRSGGPPCPPIAHYHCPMCSFSDASFGCIRAHAREAHRDTAADPRLAAAIRGLPSFSFDASVDYWVELGASTEEAPREGPPGLPAAQGAPFRDSYPREGHLGERGLTSPVVGAEGAQQKDGEGEEGGLQSEGASSPSAFCLGAPQGIASSTASTEAQGVGPLEGSTLGAPSPPLGPPPAASRASGCKTGARSAAGGLKSCLCSGLRAAAAAAGVAAATSGGHQQQQQQQQRRVAFGPHVRVRLVDKELSVMEQLGAVMGPVFGTALEKAGGNRGLLKQSLAEEGPLEESLEGFPQGPPESSKAEGPPSLPPTYPPAADAPPSAAGAAETPTAAARAAAADVLLEETDVATRVLRPRRSRGAVHAQRGAGLSVGVPLGLLPTGAPRGSPKKKQRHRGEEAGRGAGATFEVLAVRLSSSEESDTDKQQQQQQQ